MLAAGHEAAQAEVGPFERLADGTPVDPNMRAVYAEALLRHEAGMGEAPPNPFGDGDADEFLRWLEEPWGGQDDEFPVSRYLVGFHTRFDWVTGRSRRFPAPTRSAICAGCPRPTIAGTSIFPSAGCLPGYRPLRTPRSWSSRTGIATSWPRSKRSAAA